MLFIPGMSRYFVFIHFGSCREFYRLVFDQLSLGAFTLEYNLFPCIDYGDLFVFKVLEMEVPSVCLDQTCYEASFVERRQSSYIYHLGSH